MGADLMRAIILSLALGIGLSACAAPPSSPSATAPSPAAEAEVEPAKEIASLVGTQWIAASRALEPPTIEFEASGAAGFAGCNRWFAAFNQDGEGARFQSIGSTRMMCPGAAMSIERNFLSQLERTRAVRVDGRTLTLLDEEGAEIGAFLRADHANAN
jgi:heat shock protein HslJ